MPLLRLYPSDPVGHPRPRWRSRCLVAHRTAADRWFHAAPQPSTVGNVTRFPPPPPPQTNRTLTSTSSPAVNATAARPAPGLHHCRRSSLLHTQRQCRLQNREVLVWQSALPTNAVAGPSLFSSIFIQKLPKDLVCTWATGSRKHWLESTPNFGPIQPMRKRLDVSDFSYLLHN
jgi:hypothetical protein